MSIESTLLTVGVAALTAWFVAGGRHRRLRYQASQRAACPCGCLMQTGEATEIDDG